MLLKRFLFPLAAGDWCVCVFGVVWRGICIHRTSCLQFGFATAAGELCEYCLGSKIASFEGTDRLHAQPDGWLAAGGAPVVLVVLPW